MAALNGDRACDLNFSYLSMTFRKNYDGYIGLGKRRTDDFGARGARFLHESAKLMKSA
jgi:hypothetical protein